MVHTNVETLNDLIRAHADRIAAYEKANLSLKPQEAGLSSIFTEIIKESQGCIAELNSRVISDGDIPPHGETSIEGKIYRVWMDLKVSFSSNPNYSLLDVCEKGEDAMIQAYKEALKDSHQLTESDRMLLETQCEIVKKTHDLIKTKRDKYHELVKNNQII